MKKSIYLKAMAQLDSKGSRESSLKIIEISSNNNNKHHKQPFHSTTISITLALICVIFPSLTSKILPANCLLPPPEGADFGQLILNELNDNNANLGYQLVPAQLDELAPNSWPSRNENRLLQLKRILSRSSMLTNDRLNEDKLSRDADDILGPQYRVHKANGLDVDVDDENDNDSNNNDESPDDDFEASQGSHPMNGAPKFTNEIYILEDKDYPKSIYEDYSRKVGQVSGITALPNDDVAIFHRADRQWTEDTFNETSHQLAGEPSQRLAGEQQLIKNDTIMILDGENGNSIASFGSNLFYMPHSIASDPMGNLWISDVGRHQVMRLPVANLLKFRALHRDQASGAEGGGARKLVPLSDWLPGNLTTIWPDIVLGESFVPGSDESHFCQPSELAVSSNGRLLFVADGYCNKRIMVYLAPSGQYLTSFGALGIKEPSSAVVGGENARSKSVGNSDDSEVSDEFDIVHSLTLIEEKNLLCVADRENGRILCYLAGLDGDLASIGRLVFSLKYPIGRVFAIQAISQDHLLVSSNQVSTKRYDMAILNPFTEELKLVWTSSDLLEPHSLAKTFDKQYAYAADLSKDAYKKVFKFNIIQRLGVPANY